MSYLSYMPLVLPYSHNLPNVHKIVINRINILHRSRSLKEIFPDPLLVAYRRDRNLMDVLVHTKHKRTFEQQQKEKCNKCAVCPYITDKTEFTHGEGKYMSSTTNCKANNIVHGIECTKCDQIVYVGETGTTLYERIQNHLTAIRKDGGQPIPTHFNSNSHSTSNASLIEL